MKRMHADEATAPAAAGAGGSEPTERGGWMVPAVVALIGAFASAWALSPLGAGNDQGLFVYYAQRIREGALPYVDVWDNKQPGIFGFYALAGALIGEGWPAARLLYAVWLGLGAGVLAWIARAAAPGSRAWLLAPLLAVGLTLVRTNAERPAQVESLMGLPLAVLLALCVAEPAGALGRRIRWIVAGVCTALVASFKLVLAPVAAALITVALGWRIARGTCTLGEAAAAIAWSLVGFAAVAVPVVGWFVALGAGPQFAWTMLEYPRLALVEVERQRVAMLVGALRWLAVTVALLLPAIALLAWRCRGRWTGVPALVLLSGTAWIVSGLAMIVTQRFSWWDTHMDLVVWPFGLLAALGLAVAPANPARAGAHASAVPVASSAPRRGTAWLLAAAAAVLGLGVHSAKFANDWLRNPDWPKPREELAALATAIKVRDATAAPCDTVYAIGDQAGVERATGLRQALPTHGLWFGAFLPRQAERLPGELRDARPDLVYVDGAERADFARKWPQTLSAIDAWLAESYVPLERDSLGGRWYARSGAGAQDPMGCPPPSQFTVPR